MDRMYRIKKSEWVIEIYKINSFLYFDGDPIAMRVKGVNGNLYDIELGVLDPFSKVIIKAFPKDDLIEHNGLFMTRLEAETGVEIENITEDRKRLADVKKSIYGPQFGHVGRMLAWNMYSMVVNIEEFKGCRKSLPVCSTDDTNPYHIVNKIRTLIYREDVSFSTITEKLKKWSEWLIEKVVKTYNFYIEVEFEETSEGLLVIIEVSKSYICDNELQELRERYKW